MTGVGEATGSAPMPLREVAAARYVVPLREGGSLPGVIEDDDGALWVTKFRAAGQGAGALVAEVIGGELARAIGLRVPELVVLTLAKGFGLSDGDPEIHDLLVKSEGENLGLAFLSGALGFDPAAHDPIDPALASTIVAFDVLISNVDRTVRNPNLLVLNQDLWLIDHGAAVYWHHGWDGSLGNPSAPLPNLREHVLLPFATAVPTAAAALAAQVDDAMLARVLDLVPDRWLAHERAAYVARLAARRDALPALLATVGGVAATPAGGPGGHA